MMPEAGEVLNGRYEIREKIGQGGMSTVYRAMDLRLGRVVAIKVLKEELSEDREYALQFLQEARTAATIMSPYVVCTFDISGDEEPYRYLVMELVEGVTLKDYIRNKGKLSNDEAIRIALDAAAGLADSHRAGVVHRDIKPHNIVISNEGRVKILDFGIAVPSSDSTDQDAILGSVHYIAPEQASGGVADARSDIYSLGATMYEMVTGQPPFDGETPDEVLNAHRTDALVPPRALEKKVYPALSDLIVKCMRKDPAERYQSMDELITDLERCRKEPNGHFVHYYKTEQKPKKEGKNEAKGKRGLRIAAGVIAAVLFVSVTAVFLSAVYFRNKPAGTEFQPEEVTQAEGSGDLNIVISGDELMPSLTGLSVREAEELLNGKKLTLIVTGREYSDSYSEGAILQQDPEEGTQVASGDIVHVVVSRGSRLDAVVGSIKGMKVEDAVSSLQEVGIIVEGEKKQFSEDVPEGRVTGYEEIRQEEETEVSEADEHGLPVSGGEADSNLHLAPGSRVLLLVSAGKEGEGLMMPNLTGLDYSQMQAVLVSSGLVLGDIAKIPGDAATRGQITGQSVEPGTLIRKGTVIHVQMNLSPEESPETLPGTGEIYNVDSDGELSPDFWYASVDTVLQAPGTFGPGGELSYVNVGIRLIQQVNGATEYTTIMEPRPIASGSAFPVSFRNLRGARDVAEGQLEVYDADSGEILGSFSLTFEPRG